MRILEEEKLLNSEYNLEEPHHASGCFESRNAHHTIELIVHELMMSTCTAFFSGHNT